MKEVKYKKEFLSLLKDLSIIVPGTILYKQENELFIIRKSNENIYYELRAPIDYLDFDGDYFALDNFGEFFMFFNDMDEPIIYDDETHLFLTDNTTEIRYPFTDEENFLRELDKLKRKDGTWKIIQFPSEDNIEDIDFFTVIDKSFIKEIKSIASKIGNEFITVKIKNNKMLLNCFIGSEYPSWQKEYNNHKETDAEYSFKIYTDVFNFLPVGTFKFFVINGGIQLVLEHDDISLKILTAEIA